ncbi:hypothetical protein M8745_19900, partial [Lutimaribacter sp. EGI FJ00014]|nr:hypothetical protein [Lutimaribacter sp. EGI FJ00014]
DRDYRCDEEIEKFKKTLNNQALWIDVLSRKEIENYSLVGRPLLAAIHKRLRARGAQQTDQQIEAHLLELTERFRGACQAQYSANYLSFHREVDRRTAEPTHLERANQRFEAYWRDLESRLSIVPGKEFIAVLSTELQRDFGSSITINQIIDEMEPADIPADLTGKLESMAAFLH